MVFTFSLILSCLHLTAGAGDRRDLGEEILDLEEKDDLDAQFVMLD